MRMHTNRLLVRWNSQQSKGLTDSDEINPSCEIQEFQHNPGLYFEKIGELYFIKKTWKLVIKLDLTTLNKRYEQISNYLKETEKMWDTMRLQNHYHRDACSTLDIIAKKKARYLKNIMTQIQTIYKSSTNLRRGLINGIGSIAKSLFGTMDANDEKRINEQLDLLENRQQIIQHVAKNQIKILNNTIAHIEKTEDIINRNEKLLQQRVTVYTERAEINKHFIIITAVITEFIRDAENIIEYLTYTRKETMHPKLIEIIITSLKEATQQLQQGLYDIIKVITLPVPTHNNNTFIITQINNNIIAVDKEKLTYLRVMENDLKNCIKQNIKYTCENAIPIYRTNRNAPCEIQLYTQSKQHNYQQINIQCDKQTERKRIIKNTGKISLRGKCKLTTPDMTIQSTKTDNDTLKDVTEHRAELIKLKAELKKLNNNVQDNEQKFFTQKQFVYPMATS
ncbi:hypothetical protein ACFW04_006623 [Cataglyphis niger]